MREVRQFQTQRWTVDNRQSIQKYRRSVVQYKEGNGTQKGEKGRTTSKLCGRTIRVNGFHRKMSLSLVKTNTTSIGGRSAGENAEVRLMYACKSPWWNSTLLPGSFPASLTFLLYIINSTIPISLYICTGECSGGTTSGWRWSPCVGRSTWAHSASRTLTIRLSNTG